MLADVPAGLARRNQRRLPWLEWLASPYWMLAFFGFAAAGALAAAYGVSSATQLMLLPLALFALNLIAAIATRPVFRRAAPLLLFHVALLVLVVLFAAGRLTYFDGTAALTSGTEFDGQLVSEEHGLLHLDRTGQLRFANAGFDESHPQRGPYTTTYNRVRWWDEAGKKHEAEIGDDHPLLLAGYRIYTTRQRGFSPVFHWLGERGDKVYGTVQLNDLRLGVYAPANAWRISEDMEVWAMLELDEAATALAPGRRQADLNAHALSHTLVLRVGDARHELRPGDTVDLPGGRLTYVRLESWMGYRITYDPTKPWLVATVLVALGCLLLFYLRRFRGAWSLE